MNLFALLAAGLLALSAPLAWTASQTLSEAPASPSPGLPAPTPAAPAGALAPKTGTLRVRVVNEGDAATFLLSVTDSSGVARQELRTVAARATATLDYVVPLGKVTSELRNGPAGGSSTGDLSRCASRLVEQNYTISVSLTRWSLGVDSWCAAGAA